MKSQWLERATCSRTFVQPTKPTSRKALKKGFARAKGQKSQRQPKLPLLALLIER
jgi:hypothetical protein